VLIEYAWRRGRGRGEKVERRERKGEEERRSRRKDLRKRMREGKK
jgi:hypothetical protein